MLHTDLVTPNVEVDEWATRSEIWINESSKFERKRLIRERNPNPLILSGHGNSIRIEKGRLLIREGFTHYPQKVKQHCYFPGSLELPRIIMLLDGSGTISFDVISWLGEQSVALARITNMGNVSVVANASGYAANQSKIDWQRETFACSIRRMAFVQKLIQQKLKNSLSTLEHFLPDHRYKDDAIARAERGLEELKAPLQNVQQVRTIEAECASTYFRAWRNLKIQWKENSRYPIPDHWHSYRARTSIHEAKPKNQRATDPINAMLNYGYAVRTTKLQIEAIGMGYDPTLGIMHHGRREKSAYIFDLLEPEHPKVDAAILSFMKDRPFSGADFIIGTDGTCKLSPQLARVVALITA